MGGLHPDRELAMTNEELTAKLKEYGFTYEGMMHEVVETWAYRRHPIFIFANWHREKRVWLVNTFRVEQPSCYGDPIQAEEVIPQIIGDLLL